MARLYHLLLCGDLHHMAQACDATKYCDRWRGWGLPAADWVGFSHGLCLHRGGLDVCFDLYVDPTAFLGARAFHALGLR